MNTTLVKKVNVIPNHLDLFYSFLVLVPFLLQHKRLRDLHVSHIVTTITVPTATRKVKTSSKKYWYQGMLNT